MFEKGKEYYGGFFWIAVISFIVPIFVAVRAFDAATPTTAPDPNPDEAGVDNMLWNYVILNYVADGLVDYDGIARDHVFETYITQLAGANLDAYESEDHRLATLCNAYNALCINGVIKHKIRAGVDPSTFFDKKEHILGNETMSLNHIEHGIIREEFDEPRIHMALVCAAISCPSIRGEAYFGDRLEAQLADQASQFANNEKYVRYDEDDNTVHLSRIMQWYRGDWDGHGGIFKWTAELVEDPAVKQGLLDADKGEADVVFNEYDWTLNTQNEVTAAAAQSSGGGFGSGSVPNE